MEIIEIKELIKQLMGQLLHPWEQEYLDYHAARFVDTLDLLGPGEGKQLLDVGASWPPDTGDPDIRLSSPGALTGTNESSRNLDNFTSRLSRRQIPVVFADVECHAFRPDHLELIKPEKIEAEGFYELKEHDAQIGSTGRVLSTAFRWTHSQAELSLPAGEAMFQVFFFIPHFPGSSIFAPGLIASDPSAPSSASLNVFRIP